MTVLRDMAAVAFPNAICVDAPRYGESEGIEIRFGTRERVYIGVEAFAVKNDQAVRDRLIEQVQEHIRGRARPIVGLPTDEP